MLQKRRRSHPTLIYPSGCLPPVGALVPSSSQVLALEGTPGIHVGALEMRAWIPSQHVYLTQENPRGLEDIHASLTRSTLIESEPM
jgi:hypothetical protein